MSRPPPPRPIEPAHPAGGAAFVSPGAFLLLAAVFLLLCVGMLAATWRQAGARAELETVVPLPLPPPPPPRVEPPPDAPLPEP